MISKVSASLALLAFALQSSAQVAAYGQCGGNNFSGSTTCVSGFTCKFASEWYSQCVPGTGGSPITTVKTTTKSVAAPIKTTTAVISTSTVKASSTKSASASVATTVKTSSIKSTTTSVVPPKPTTVPAGENGGGIVTPTAVTTVFPTAVGETKLPAPTTISGVFDGKMARWHRTSADVCQGQVETGVKDTIFVLEDGATLANVIIGPNQAEGVHCLGTCTLINVWHEKVCEDAMTFKQKSGTSYVIGGGSRGGTDKTMQFNGSGTVSVKYFYAENGGKLMRHCGTCGLIQRHSTFEGIVANKMKIVVGVNSNTGDSASIISSCLKGGTKFGDYFEAVSSGEPKKLGACPFGTTCVGINNVSDC